jgi:ubiquinone/menaquinone biosynthesis C-methylase UbiE
MSETPHAKDSVRRYFDGEVADYLDAYEDRRKGDVRHDAFAERRDLVLAMTPLSARRVLDIGAGPGVFTPRLLERGAACTVVDLSYEMVAVARRQMVSGVERARFMVGDVDRLPLATASFDAALCVGVLQYLPSLEFALAELARVVAPGGHVIVTFPNARSPFSALHRAAVGVARGTLAAARSVGLAGAPDPSRLTFRQDIPNRWFSAEQIADRARPAGLRVDDVKYHLLQFPFAVPGLGFALSAWNRRVLGRAPRGPLAVWGREGIMRLIRE